MLTGRQAALLAALGLAAASVGFAGAAALGGDGSPPPSPPPAAAARATAAPAEEALLPPEPPVAPAPPAPRPPPAPVPPVAARPAPRDVPAAPGAPAAPDREAAPGAGARPDAGAGTRSEPGAGRAPAPPRRPSIARLAEPAAPPRGVTVPAGEAPGGWDAARRALADALSRASEGSADASDIGRQLALWRAYLAPDAPPAPAGRRATVARALRANAWWFARRGAPRERVLLRDPDGILLTYRAGHGFSVNPVATTGRWRGLNADVPAAALADALLSMAVPRRAGARRFLAWEYYDVADDPAAIRPGVSAMAQARVALTLAHARAQTGEPRFSAAAAAALGALTVDVDEGGARTMVSTEPGQAPMAWYVERAYPGESPWKGGALNGFMVTILNLRGTAELLRRSPGPGPDGPGAARLAIELADRGAGTLERHLADHDTGAWSLYGLLTPGRPWRSYLADLNYHCYHVRLLEQLAVPYPQLGFAGVAARWRGYVDGAGVTCPPRPADGSSSP